MSGKFITFEGIDGAGKSSHVEWLAQWLRERGKTVVVTREPGGTALGERLRDLLLNEAMHLETETLLMFAARGEWVICDRFSDATYAYQGGGRGLDRAKFAALEHWVHAHLQPDLTLLFDLPLDIARERIVLANRQLDRFEQERVDFHDRVRQAYLDRALHHGNRMRVIDANQSLDEIRKVLVNIVTGIAA